MPRKAAAAPAGLYAAEPVAVCGDCAPVKARALDGGPAEGTCGCCGRVRLLVHQGDAADYRLLPVCAACVARYHPQAKKDGSAGRGHGVRVADLEARIAGLAVALADPQAAGLSAEGAALAAREADDAQRVLDELLPGQCYHCGRVAGVAARLPQRALQAVKL